MRKLKVLIIGENKKIVEELVQQHPSFEVLTGLVGCEGFNQAITELEPDVLIAHITNQECMTIMQDMRSLHPTLQIIFVAASDAFALQAFEIHAIDYLLTPITNERMLVALNRAYETVWPRTYNKQNNIKIEVKFGNDSYFIKLDDIYFIEKMDRKLFIHTNHNIYETIDTLENFECILPDHFVQSHRSYLINLNHVSQIKISGNSCFAFFYDYKTYAQIAKQKVAVMKELIKERA